MFLFVSFEQSASHEADADLVVCPSDIFLVEVDPVLSGFHVLSFRTRQAGVLLVEDGFDFSDQFVPVVCSGVVTVF